MAWNYRPIRLLVGVAAIVACGCGDKEPAYCDVVEYATWTDGYCQSTAILGARYGQSITLTQEDLDFYYDLLRPMWIAEPLSRLAGATATHERANVITGNPVLVEPWLRGELRTGDPTVDEIFVDAGAIEINGFCGFPFGDDCFFGVGYQPTVNVYVLQQRVGVIPDTRVDIDPLLPNNITIEWRGDIAEVRLVAGWVDCFSGCGFYHTFHATLGGGEVIEFLDLGGDPIPPEMIETAANNPPR